ncbi:MAG: adenosine deaminase [Reyranella sp.]|uniref:adenosine deaminase n=1 Tax=Reyranella sp. TaxID=1929291 RepID=UPI001AC5EDF3|nr:adenosine deaminase [Reyranella sp.]MBN9089756.1 adenosine deaminase [Reyranella sp.]
MNVDPFIAGLPKAELHIHIEGSLEPELTMALAERNKVALRFGSIDALRAAYRFSDLQDFLDLYYEGMRVLLHEQDFYDLAMAYFRKAAAQNVRHAEIFFDPQGHTGRGVPFKTVIEGLTRARVDAERRFGITSALILCFLRHLDEADAERTLDEALPWRDRFIGVGLDSSEKGRPPRLFERVFARARGLGLRAVAHAGEEGPAGYVREALDLLKVERIDHGNRALDDAELTARLARERMPLTVCPLSNLRLCVVPDLKDHPLRRMLDRGLTATINSDDPAYFGGYMNENFAALSLSREETMTLARNGFRAAFCDEATKQRHLEALDDYGLSGA